MEQATYKEKEKMLQLHMIPSSGDATLLRFREDEDEVNILIDGGNRRNNCTDYLNKLGVKHIDLIVVSHLDEDHIRGLRRVTDEIDVRELWVTNISRLIQPAIESGSLYMLKCFFETSLIVDSRGLQGKDKFAVYEGYERQIGPFHFQVLSPPKSLHNYLSRSDAIRKILESKKGQTIKNYVAKLVDETMAGMERGEKSESWEEIVSGAIKRFEVDTPQLQEIEERIESDEYDPTWPEEKYYESARSLFNDISIVVSITYNYHGITKRFLFPGDLTNWSIILARYPQQIRNRILKVPHHGSEIYYDLETYNSVLFETYFDPDLWRKLPPSYFRLLKERLHTVWLENQTLSTVDSCFGPLSGRLPFSWSEENVFNWLAPERALIYPFVSHSLPNPDVRNKIINASNAMCCAFKQGSINRGKHAQSDSCISYYNCVERDGPVVFEWKRARDSSWARRFEEHPG